MPRFSYSPGDLFRLIQAIQAKVLTASEGKVVISGEQAVHWLGNYPPQILDLSLETTSGWFIRQLKSGTALTELDYIKYASATMRNKYDAHVRLEGAQKAKLRAEWDAMSPKQQAEYPRGFEDFVDLSGGR